MTQVAMILALMILGAVVVFGLVFGVFTWVYLREEKRVYVPSERAEVVSPWSQEVQDTYRRKKAA